MGMSVRMSKIVPEDVRHFLHGLDEFRAKIDRKRLYGNPEALAAIRRHLPPSIRGRRAA